ncbi:glutamine amidotransferase [Sphingobium sp. PNB]|uniref:glutamine amidotransferase n=1 Tax=Sphingobium sp. PNB TaxID=863934 RepID=UPI001CA4181A|nr:glutamine amidotransferase [Sphingobium sp. PNB]MCB4858431.1 glutamine amidotransferase [Sphingobium sp. PNB]
MKTAAALRHVAFEDLGSFELPLREAGYDIRYHDVGTDAWHPEALLDASLLIALGGPIGVYESPEYPFLADELALVGKRLASKAPILGICLGAQIIASALGARVAATGRKEIGFAPITLSEAGQVSPLRHLAAVPVLHWHGDMFEIPEGATLLAATEICPHQAFAIESHVLGLQFHPEVDATTGFERWLVGHAAELASAGVDPCRLRSDAQAYGTALRYQGQAMFRDWLAAL